MEVLVGDELVRVGGLQLVFRQASLVGRAGGVGREADAPAARPRSRRVARPRRVSVAPPAAVLEETAAGRLRFVNVPSGRPRRQRRRTGTHVVRVRTLRSLRLLDPRVPRRRRPRPGPATLRRVPVPVFRYPRGGRVQRDGTPQVVVRDGLPRTLRALFPTIMLIRYLPRRLYRGRRTLPPPGDRPSRRLVYSFQLLVGPAVGDGRGRGRPQAGIIFQQSGVVGRRPPGAAVEPVRREGSAPVDRRRRDAQARAPLDPLPPRRLPPRLRPPAPVGDAVVVPAAVRSDAVVRPPFLPLRGGFVRLPPPFVASGALSGRRRPDARRGRPVLPREYPPRGRLEVAPAVVPAPGLAARGRSHGRADTRGADTRRDRSGRGRRVRPAAEVPRRPLAERFLRGPSAVVAPLSGGEVERSGRPGCRARVDRVVVPAVHSGRDVSVHVLSGASAR